MIPITIIQLISVSVWGETIENTDGIMPRPVLSNTQYRGQREKVKKTFPYLNF